MRGKRGIFIAAMLTVLAACADHGTTPTAMPGGNEQGAIAFQLLKSETPADAWVIEARLEREGYSPLKQSVLVRTSTDTIKITMGNVAAGEWRVTVEAKDSAGNIRYTGTSSVQIIEGQTVQAMVQMNRAGGTGKLEIIVMWPSEGRHIQIRVAGSFFQAEKVVPVSVTNVSGEVVIPSTCCTRPDLRVQQKVNGTWTAPGACELMCPAVIHPMKPGERIVDTAVHIAQPGLYRLLLRYYTTTSRGDARVCEAISNEFTIFGLRRESPRLGEEFVLRVGESTVFKEGNLTLTFQDVTEDSRCPEGAVCVWAGNARILIGVNDSTFALNSTLNPKQAVFGRYVIKFNSLSPYPMIEREIDKGEYAAALVVTAAGDSR